MNAMKSKTCSAPSSAGTYECLEPATVANVGKAEMAKLQKAAAGIETKPSNSAKAPQQSAAAVDADGTPLYPVDSCQKAQPEGEVVQTRFEACQLDDWVADIYQTDDDGSQELIGWVDGIDAIYSQMVDGSTNWASGVDLEVLDTVGAGASAVLTAEPVCAGDACNVLEIDAINMDPVTAEDEQIGSAYYDWTPVKGGTGLGEVAWTVTVETPGAVPGTAEFRNVPTRCDKALPNSNSVGCVDPDTTEYILFDTTVLPSFTHHLAEALGSGLPGADYGSNPSPLHRLVNATLRNKNRSTACPASFPRPSGESCDEYPFASTKEGAFTGNGAGARTFDGCDITLPNPSSTGPTGCSVCMIDATQNSKAGSDLQVQLYRPYRMLDGDTFNVDYTVIN
ncbi:deoxyribonuclease NucA/NucB [Frondihabitans australicus]|uniref:Deoxyribonuclease NucA/NucB n=2 Tax=Frondihabitans australicus TaxID=386892 RepID=A0A495IDH2_9MICO|nr:deoxyribonuclease NucA/NucB [Frondihabitans australicus]